MTSCTRTRMGRPLREEAATSISCALTRYVNCRSLLALQCDSFSTVFRTYNCGSTLEVNYVCSYYVLTMFSLLSLSLSLFSFLPCISETQILVVPNSLKCVSEYPLDFGSRTGPKNSEIFYMEEWWGHETGVQSQQRHTHRVHVDPDNGSDICPNNRPEVFPDNRPQVFPNRSDLCPDNRSDLCPDLCPDNRSDLCPDITRGHEHSEGRRFWPEQWRQEI